MNESLRYVILHHTGYGEDHYDLMFETAPGSRLMTWRATTWPFTDINHPITPLADHRSEYLDYEGPVSGGRGEVRRLHAGTHQITATDPILLITRVETGEVWRLFHHPGECYIQILR